MSHKTRSVTCSSGVTELLELQLPGHNVTLTLPLRTCCRSRRRRACSVYLFPFSSTPWKDVVVSPAGRLDLTDRAHVCRQGGGVAGRREAVGAFPAGETVVTVMTGKKEVELRGCFHVEDWAGMLKAHKAPPQTHHCSDTCTSAQFSSTATAVPSLSHL